jgi:hypothetical protein
MKKACLVVDPFYFNNRIFDMSDQISNRDNCLYLFYVLKQQFKKYNIDISTQDINSIDESDIVIYNEMPKKLPKQDQVKKSYLLVFESSLIRPDNYDTGKHESFKSIFTWNNELVDNKKYFKINFSHKIPSNFKINKKPRNGFCCVISANKSSTRKNELYSERVRAIRWFEKKHIDNLDLYGIGWDVFKFKGKFLSKFNRFKFLGKVLSKLSLYPSYKVSSL